MRSRASRNCAKSTSRLNHLTTLGASRSWASSYHKLARAQIAADQFLLFQAVEHRLELLERGLEVVVAEQRLEGDRALGLLWRDQRVEDGAAQEQHALRHAGDRIVQIPLKQALDAADAIEILFGQAQPGAALALDRLAIHFAAGDLQEHRVEVDGGEQVDEPDDELLIERNVREDERRDNRLPGTEGGERQEAVLVREDVRELVAELVELGEIVLAQADREPDVPHRMVHERGEQVDELAAHRRPGAGADEELFELIEDEHQPFGLRRSVRPDPAGR